MSIDQGGSLQFEPGSALNFDIQHSDHEDEDDAEDVKQREKELEDFLTKTTAFDDLIDGDYETSIDASDVDESRLSERPINDKHVQCPTEKKTETSTPRHEVPHWNMDYTPIDPPTNPALLPYHLRNTSDSCDISFNIQAPNPKERLTSNAVPSKATNVVYHNSFVTNERYSHSNGHIEEDRNHISSYQQSLDILKEKLPHSGSEKQDNTVVPNMNGGLRSSNYQHYPEEILELKEKLIQQREESLQTIRGLKHELTLLKGEKESISFSLQQARDLLVSKNQDIQSLQSRYSQTDAELLQERNNNQVLLEQLQACESLALSLQTQVSELSTFQGYSKRLETQENLMKNMQQSHQHQVDTLNDQLDEKVKELELLHERVQHLEKYQEQTLPNKMHGIDKLTLNLETVQKYCQQILSSEAFHDVDVMRIHQLEDEKLKNWQKEQVEALMMTINKLNEKLQMTANQESLPLSSHRSMLKQIEEEKSQLDRKLQDITHEFEELKKSHAFLAEENRKLQGAMKTMIMKHDLDIKSAIEKYHTIQREETKLLQAELRETAEREKDQMRDFYENKISILCQDAERVQMILHETKELYVRVCEEKSVMENKIQNMGASGDRSNIPRTSHQVSSSLEETYQTLLKHEMEKAKSAWELKKTNEIETALSNYKENLHKEIESRETNSSDKTKELELKLQKMEGKLKSFAEAEQKQLQSLHEHYSALWMERQKEMHEMYKTKLDQIDQVQKRELNNAMEEMHKAMEQDRNEQMGKHQDIMLKLKKAYDSQQDKVKRLEEFQKNIQQKLQQTQGKEQQLVQKINQLEQENRTKSEVIQSKEQAFLEKFNLLNQEVNILQKDKELLVRNAADLENNARRKKSSQQNHSMGSQTEMIVVPKEEVIELQHLCVDLLSQMEEEMEKALAGSSKRAGEHLKLAILEYQHELSKELACPKAVT